MRLSDGTVVKHDAHTLEKIQPDGTTLVTIRDGAGNTQELKLDKDRTYLDDASVRRRYYSQEELAAKFNSSAEDGAVYVKNPAEASTFVGSDGSLVKNDQPTALVKDPEKGLLLIRCKPGSGAGGSRKRCGCSLGPIPS